MAVPTTHEERRALLEAPHVTAYLSRCEVIDENDQIVDDIVDLVTECSVRHEADQDVQRSCEVTTYAQLAWGRHYLRPWIYIASAGWSDEIPLGLFATSAPRPDGAMRPARYSVTCLDKLVLLHQPISRTISFPAGAFVLDSVRQLLAGVNITTVGDEIDDSRASDVLPEARSWPVTEDTTTLTVINALLEMVSYDRLSLTGQGLPAAGPKVAAADRQIFWTYDAQAPATLVKAGGREVVDQFTDTPNVWVFYSNSTERDTPPVNGDGLFTYRNETYGPSSISARGGIEVPSVQGIEALTQADLETNGLAVVSADLMSGRRYRWSSWPNPYHHHLDMFDIADRDYGVAGQFEERFWELDVIGRHMEHEAVTIDDGLVT